MNSSDRSRADELRREEEKLKRRILHANRFCRDRWREISLLYRLADSYGKRVFPHSLCHAKVSTFAGCVTGECCRCRPDVFAYEKDVLDLLPKRLDNAGYCPFFNIARKTCGIYAVRPFACRVYYNVAESRHYCQNPADDTLQFFDTIKRHVEKTLGRHLGGYTP